MNNNCERWSVFIFIWRVIWSQHSGLSKAVGDNYNEICITYMCFPPNMIPDLLRGTWKSVSLDCHSVCHGHHAAFAVRFWPPLLILLMLLSGWVIMTYFYISWLLSSLFYIYAVSMLIWKEQHINIYLVFRLFDKGFVSSTCFI